MPRQGRDASLGLNAVAGQCTLGSEQACRSRGPGAALVVVGVFLVLLVVTIGVGRREHKRVEKRRLQRRTFLPASRSSCILVAKPPLCGGSQRGQGPRVKIHALGGGHEPSAERGAHLGAQIESARGRGRQARRSGGASGQPGRGAPEGGRMIHRQGGQAKALEEGSRQQVHPAAAPGGPVGVRVLRQGRIAPVGVGHPLGGCLSQSPHGRRVKRGGACGEANGAQDGDYIGREIGGQGERHRRSGAFAGCLGGFGSLGSRGGLGLSGLSRGLSRVVGGGGAAGWALGFAAA